jgi:threonine dehydrogenase-like Zn-dependent dehydrogenase
MQILQLTAPGSFEIFEMPTPVPTGKQILLKIEAVTTCPQWDLHLRHNEPMFPGHILEFPFQSGQPGHEAAGEIAAIGPDVTMVKVGDRVASWRHQPMDAPGAYAQYAIIPESEVLHIPEHLTAADAAPLELAMCVGGTFLKLNRFDAIKGERCAVMGLGPAGLIAAQMLRAEGASEVIGFDLSPTRRESAASVLDAAYDPREIDEKFPSRAKDGVPAIHTIVDCVGAKASVEWAMDHAAHFVALFGVQREAYTFAVHHYSNLNLLGYPGHSREAAEYAMSLLEAKKLNLTMLSTFHMPLSQYNDGIELLEKQEAVKICFYPWK